MIARDVGVLGDPTPNREVLMAQWVELFGRPPAPNLIEQLLRAGIAYERQAQTHGRLGRRLRDDLLRRAASPDRQPTQHPRAGAQLVREWNGVTHVVEVIEDGFRYKDRTFASLTAIAFEITGARWSGPRFFGLRARTAS